MEFDINQCTIFKTISGSRLYGTYDETSDYDYRGVCIPPERYWFGFNSRFEQYTPKNEDVCIYGLSKFVSLAAQNNPNVIELLWVPEEYWSVGTQHWRKLVEHRDLFLSKKCYHSFRGYAHSQLRRLRNHREWVLKGELKKPTREEFGLSAEVDIPTELISSANELINLRLQQFDIEQELSKLPKEDATGIRMSVWEFLETTLAMSRTEIDDAVWGTQGQLLGYDDNLMEILRKERAYQRARKEYQSWLHWKGERNPRRKAVEERHGYDTKHAVHLVRLLLMCKEILTEHTMNVVRPDAETVLLPIKRGEWSYEHLMEFEENISAELAELYKTSTLQNKPRTNKIEELSIDLAKSFLGFTPEPKIDSGNCGTCNYFVPGYGYGHCRLGNDTGRSMCRFHSKLMKEQI